MTNVRAWSTDYWSRPIFSPTNDFAGLIAGLIAGFALLVAGCSAERSDPTGSAARGEITVSAAASLTGAFTALAEDFEATRPGTRVILTFDSSSTLAAQIAEGAPADVFASADQANTTKLAAQGFLVGASAVFARNKLVVITKPTNPANIKSLADLTTAGVISLCAKSAPCGVFAAQALRNAGVTIRESSVTRGQNAQATLTAVSEGDAQAGIVYATDALAAGDRVHVVTIPASQNVIASYPIAVLSRAEQNPTARAFTSYVLSPAGAKILKEFGFLRPA